MPVILLTDILEKDTIFTALKAKDKTEALNTLVKSLHINDRRLADETLQAIYDREEIISTGVGNALAIPHCKINGLDKNYAAFAVLDHPVKFESVDEQPVQIIFLLAGPKEEKKNHLKLLSRISRMLNSGSFREKLVDLKSGEAVLEAFHQEETKYTFND